MAPPAPHALQPCTDSTTPQHLLRGLPLDPTSVSMCVTRVGLMHHYSRLMHHYWAHAPLLEATVPFEGHALLQVAEDLRGERSDRKEAAEATQASPFGCLGWRMEDVDTGDAGGAQI